MTEVGLRLRCRTPGEAREVVALLVSRHVAPERIEVISAEPLHDVGEALTGRSRLRRFVLSGAVTGAVAGCALAVVSARSYPINTGGMPIVSPMPVGIVTYEAMMLFAVLFTLAGVLVEARLGRRRPPGADRFLEPLLDGEVHVLTRVGSEDEAESLRRLVEGVHATPEA